jgi:hypothetical protein
MGCLVPARSRRCGDITCANWPYRMKANPFRARGLVTETQRAALERARLTVRPGYCPGESEEQATEVVG